MRILLVRHGETEENVAGIIQGHLPGRLSARGRAQVEALGRRLASERIDAVYSSDLARARETTEAILHHHPGVAATYTEEMRERFLGSLQGRSGSDVDWGTFQDLPDVESDDELLARARRVLERLQREQRAGTVLLSGHGGINTALVAAVTGRTISQAKTEVVMDNAGVCVFERRDGHLELVTLNDTGHLVAKGTP
jgi:2,3-bisphosphoglycerate-dependent phosphoglycerate mutase